MSLIRSDSGSVVNKAIVHIGILTERPVCTQEDSKMMVRFHLTRKMYILWRLFCLPLKSLPYGPLQISPTPLIYERVLPVIHIYSFFFFFLGKECETYSPACNFFGLLQFTQCNIKFI